MNACWLLAAGWVRARAACESTRVHMSVHPSVHVCMERGHHHGMRVRRGVIITQVITRGGGGGREDQRLANLQGRTSERLGPTSAPQASPLSAEHPVPSPLSAEEPPNGSSLPRTASLSFSTILFIFYDFADQTQAKAVCHAKKRFGAQHKAAISRLSAGPLLAIPPSTTRL